MLHVVNKMLTLSNRIIWANLRPFVCVLLPVAYRQSFYDLEKKESIEHIRTYKISV